MIYYHRGAWFAFGSFSGIIDNFRRDLRFSEDLSEICDGRIEVSETIPTAR